MSEGEQHDNNLDDRKRLLDHIFILLDYLERQSDNRLQEQFDDTRIKLGVNSLKVAIPPCNNYNEFFGRLAEIKQNTALSATDEQFLRSSRDFLAVVAHPATVETISITREYINTRAAHAAGGWRLRLQKWAVFIRLGQTSAVTKEDGFKNSAHYLARTVRRAEQWAVLATVLALFFSGHAMVGRLIIDQEKAALTKFQELTKATDADRIGLLRVPGAATLVKQKPDRGCPAEYPVEANHDGTPQMAKNAEQQGLAASTQAIGIADSYIAAQEATWTLITKCREVQSALMQLVTENIRLKSWDALYVKFASFLIGWDEPTIKSVRKASDPEFCGQVASAYHEDPGVGCKKIFNLLIRDSSSLANSVLGWLTLYILPCLYAFIGAAAAAVLGIRRKLNASLLAYSDRGWVTQALILGFVFGGVIGLFAGYLSKSPDSGGLSLSALALLAGYNVPAVSEMLEDLSKRIFRPGERDGQTAKAA